MAWTNGISGAWLSGGPLLDQVRKRSLVLLVALMSKSLFALAAHGEQPASHPLGAHGKGPALHIAPAGWGDTDPRELASVLNIVAAEFGSHFPGRDVGDISVVPGEQVPMVLFERGESGEYVVQLAARDARWYQFVYQFAHELCHIYSNFDSKEQVDGRTVSLNQWFEESLCEAAALYTLNRIAARWEGEPATAEWRPHAPILRKYADMLRQQPHRHLRPNETLPNWYHERRHTLRGNPYLRRDGEVVSNLLLARFEQDPASWAAIGYLNEDRADASKSFEDYLAAWCQACPDRYRDLVADVMAMFGMAPPAVELPRGA